LFSLIFAGSYLSPEFLGLMGAGSSVAPAAPSSPAIGQAGVNTVMNLLNDPSAQREVSVYVNEAGKRANLFARFDILTVNAIHEVKNVADLSLSQRFMEQALKYKALADASGLELHYWLLNDAPPNVVQWLNSIGVIVHTP
jgi:hypothetical protein